MYNYLSCMSAVNSIDLQLILMQQCCDHPYLVDQSLQSTLTKDRPITDILDIGVRSCGKLLLLDRMLQQIKIQGLKEFLFFRRWDVHGIMLPIFFYLQSVHFDYRKVSPLLPPFQNLCRFNFAISQTSLTLTKFIYKKNAPTSTTSN